MTDELTRMVALADALEGYVLPIIGGELKFEDNLELAMAVAFTATRMLYKNAIKGGRPDLAMKSAKIMADSGLRSMADMIAGANTEHQVTQ